MKGKRAVRTEEVTSAPYFYHSPDDRPGRMSKEESMHAYRVLRLQEGSPIRITDGRGHLFDAVVTEPSAEGTGFEIVQEIPQAPSPFPKFRLAISPTKNIERIEWMIEKLTECGVMHYDLVMTERTIRKKVNTERLHRILIAAMKQSQGVCLPELSTFSSLREYLSTNLPPQRMIAHCCEEEPKQDIRKVYKEGVDTVVLIGPEGDFTSEEISLCLLHDFQPVTLGDRRLRTETAGMYVGLLHTFIHSY